MPPKRRAPLKARGRGDRSKSGKKTQVLSDPPKPIVHEP